MRAALDARPASVPGMRRNGQLAAQPCAGLALRMRVLLVCHGFPPDSIGGVEQHVDGLSQALVQQGHSVHVLTRANGNGEPQGTRLGLRSGNPTVTGLVYRWEGLHSLRDTYTCPPMADAVAAFLREQHAAGQRFDLVHVHHLIGLSIDSLRVFRAAGLPLVMTVHDYWLPCPRGQMWRHDEQVCEQLTPERCGPCLQATFPHWVGADDRETIAAELHAQARAVLALPDALVVPSARAIPAYAALGVDARRFTVVENGVDTPALTQLDPPPAGPGPLRLGYLGTLLPSKGLHVLLAAIQRLPAGLVDLQIHGNAVSYHGDDRYLLRCFQQLRPGSRVHYHGPYTTTDLPRLLAGIDVLCAPALWHEAFGLTVREALAAARPVLVSRIGGLQDAVRHGDEGLVLPPGDIAAWAAAILDLARDRSRVRAMAARTRSRARGFAAMATDLLAVYHRVLGTAGAAAAAADRSA